MILVGFFLGCVTAAALYTIVWVQWPWFRKPWLESIGLAELEVPVA